MSGRLSLVSVFCVMLGVVAVRNVLSDDVVRSAPTVLAQVPAEPKEATARKKPRGRLPNYYGQLGISEQQRTQIYKIQGGYSTQIEKLRGEIEDLEQKRNTEMREILSEEQRTRYDALVAKAKEKRDAARKKRAKKTAS